MTTSTGTGPGERTLSTFSGPLVLAGAGKMGGAMLQGWLALGLDPKRTILLEPQPSAEVEALRERGLRINPHEAAPAATVVIAVKPQIAPDIMPALMPFVGPATLVLSIMAGRTLRFLTDALPPKTAIVRAMPNTAAAVGRSMTVVVANPFVAAAQRDIAQDLLAAIGSVEWIIDERLMNAVTAVSGSGPAYVFLLAEALTQAGIEVGLPRPLAIKLARETIAGSGELLHRSPLGADILRQNVTSPGGTTAAALEVLMARDGLAALMNNAVAAAARRSRELAG
jgi:pyrroline-5-carboxylate reductase